MKLSNSELETVEDPIAPGAIRQKCEVRGERDEGERRATNALCPMPYALCPMPHSPHL